MNELAKTDYTRFQTGYELSFPQKVAFSAVVGVALLAIAIGLMVLHTNGSSMTSFQGLGEMRVEVASTLIGLGTVAITGILGYFSYLNIRHNSIKALFAPKEEGEDELLFETPNEYPCFWEFPLWGTPTEMRVHIKKENFVESYVVSVIEEESVLPSQEKNYSITRRKLEQCRAFQAFGQTSSCRLIPPLSLHVPSGHASIQTQ